MLRKKLDLVLEAGEQYLALSEEEQADQYREHPGAIPRLLVVSCVYGSAESYGRRVERLLVGVFDNADIVEKISYELQYGGVPKKLRHYSARYFGRSINVNLEWLAGTDKVVDSLYVPPRFEMTLEDFGVKL